ncbi:MAG: hypothetical protein R3A13_09755 [Bdellovibrionota bacterium]
MFKAFLKITALTLLIFLIVPSTETLAQTDIYVRGSGKLFPIALPRLCTQGDAVDESKMIADVIARDLDLSGFFEVLNPNSYIETPGKCSGQTGFAYTDWSVVGAEGLVKGEIEGTGSSLTVRLFLHDVQRQKVVLGKEYQAHPSQVRALAHKFANEIMKFFTGIPGVFGTQIAYSGRVGRFKELFVMDMDGSGAKQITDDKGLAISASWSPAGNSLIYTSYRQRVPDLFTVDLSSRKINQFTSGVELDIGAKYLSDGSAVIASQTIGGASDIILYNTSGKILKNLTRQNGLIDVSPSVSPDGSSVAFCSNRSGGPQIYVMSLDGSNSRRISFVSSNYCTSPTWSPTGKKIAFVCRAEGGHQIFTTNPDGSQPLQLTSFGNNEDPSWSPDGRYLTFATTFGKGGVFNIAMMRDDGSNIRQLTYSRTGSYQPSWGPLLKP